MNNRYVDERNSRGTKQDAHLQAIIDADEDPFHPDNILKHNPKGFVYENLSWMVIPNKYEYENVKHHFVIVLRRYAENFTELNEIELEDLRLIVSWLQRTYNAPGGGIIMRTGNTLYSGATVKRFHGHFIVPDIDSPTYSPTNRVKVFIGGNKEKPEQNG